MRNVLITKDEVLHQVQTEHTVDMRHIQNAIVIAEERFIRPALGYDLYETLIAAKNLLITSGNKVDQQALLNASLLPGTTLTLKEGDVLNSEDYLSADQKLLWRQGNLWKLTAECVMLLVYPDAYVQYTAAGVVHTTPPAGPMTTTGNVSPELRSVKWVMDKKMMDRIDPLTEAMHVWLCKNKTKFSDYKKDCDCDVNGVAYKRKTDFVFGIYDDDGPRNNCCDD